jgi:hypothetical protein
VSRDSKIFFAIIGLLIVAGLTAIIVGIYRITAMEDSIRATARIYRPGGCEYLGRVERAEGKILLKCGNSYELVDWREFVTVGH